MLPWLYNSPRRQFNWLLVCKKNQDLFHYKVKPSFSPSRLRVLTPELPKVYSGGIHCYRKHIPNGVLHEEFNKLGIKECR
jgi:hypothetical protein